MRLTPSESVLVTEDDTVIDGLHVSGRITIEADNVTIRNTLVQTDTTLYPIRVEDDTTGTLIEDVEVDNLGGAGIGIFLSGSGTIRRVNIHSAGDGIRIQSDDVIIEDSYIHDLRRHPGGHHDTIQIRNGDNVTIRGNTLLAYKESTDDPMNAAIQLGSLLGDDWVTDLVVVGNYMDGGSYTINGGLDIAESEFYGDNRFGRNFRFGAVGNLSPDAVWEETNVYHDTGEPVRSRDG